MVGKGITLRDIAALDGMPSPYQIIVWSNEKTEWATQYAYARKIRADICSESVYELALDIIDMAKDGERNHTLVNAAAHQLNAIKWLNGRYHPSRYGTTRIEAETKSNINIVIECPVTAAAIASVKKDDD